MVPSFGLKGWLLLDNSRQPTSRASGSLRKLRSQTEHLARRPRKQAFDHGARSAIEHGRDLPVLQQRSPWGKLAWTRSKRGAHLCRSAHSTLPAEADPCPEAVCASPLRSGEIPLVTTRRQPKTDKLRGLALGSICRGLA